MRGASCRVSRDCRVQHRNSTVRSSFNSLLDLECNNAGFCVSKKSVFEDLPWNTTTGQPFKILPSVYNDNTSEYIDG